MPRSIFSTLPPTFTIRLLYAEAGTQTPPVAILTMLSRSNLQFLGRTAEGLRHCPEAYQAEIDRLIHANHRHMHDCAGCTAIVTLRTFIRIEMDKHRRCLSRPVTEFPFSAYLQLYRPQDLTFILMTNQASSTFDYLSPLSSLLSIVILNPSIGPFDSKRR
jgi:hypothetical protein